MKAVKSIKTAKKEQFIKGAHPEKAAKWEKDKKGAKNC